MSKIGKKPVTIPVGTNVVLTNGVLHAKGPKGELKMAISDKVNVVIDNSNVVVSPINDVAKHVRAMWGLTRALINNMIHGVSVGFSKRLELIGVGYKASVSDGLLLLSLGYSCEIAYPANVNSVKVSCVSDTVIEVSGHNKQEVGEVAAQIRALKKPEPYKGKGIRYSNEQILRKEGKKK